MLSYMTKKEITPTSHNNRKLLAVTNSFLMTHVLQFEEFNFFQGQEVIVYQTTIGKLQNYLKQDCKDINRCYHSNYTTTSIYI